MQKFHADVNGEFLYNAVVQSAVQMFQAIAAESKLVVHIQQCKHVLKYTLSTDNMLHGDMCAIVPLSRYSILRFQV